MNKPSLKPILNRIDIIDAFRGFALAGIVFVHFVEQFIGGPAPEGAMESVVRDPLDQGVDIFVNLFLRGKFFALFSLLFGLSFFIQMDRAAKRGVDFRARFAWRLLLLFSIGYLHHLFYRGDILTLYAVLGLLLVLFHNVSNKWLFGIMILIFLGLPRYLIFGLFGAGSLFGQSGFMPGSPELTAYFNTLESGSLWSVFVSNASEGMLIKADFQIGVISRGYLTFAFFLGGMMLGRMRFFEDAALYTTQLKRAMRWSIAVLAGVITISVTLFLTQNLSEIEGLDSWTVMFGLTLYDLMNLSLTVIIFSLFVLAYQNPWGVNYFRWFIPYGRTALTNYVLQSVAGTAILYGWGLGLLGELRNIHTFAIGFGVLVLQILISRLWMRFFRYGPLEWLWRMATYTKLFPLANHRKAER